MNSAIIDVSELDSLRYYGLNDYSTGMDLKKLIKNHEKIIEYFKDSKFEINNVEQYVDYLFILKITKMKEITDIADFEGKNVFMNLFNNIEKIYKKYNKKDVIQYINTKIDEILLENDYILGIDEITIELIASFHTAISDETLKSIFLQKPYIIVDNYNNLSKRIESSENLMEIMSSEDTVAQLIQNRNKELFVILKGLYRKSKKKQYAEKIIQIIVEEKKTIIEKINSDNALFYNNDLKEIYEFLNEIKHPDASIFEQKYNELDGIVDDYLKKHGQTFEYKLPLNKINEFLESSYPVEYKVLFSTHHLDKDKRIMEANLNDKIVTNTPFLDNFSGISSNDYFKTSVQEMLNTQIRIGASLIHNVCKIDIKNEYFQYVINEMYTINEKIGIKNNDIVLEFKEIVNSILFLNQNDNMRLLERYGLFMFICSFTEKFLRSTMSRINANGEYIDPHNVGMGNLFENKTIKDVLGEYQIKHINFILSYDKDGKIGHNWRDKLAHWDYISFRDLNVFRINEAFYCLLSIVNSYFLKYADE